MCCPAQRAGRIAKVDVPQLRCFIAVAEELHFGRAARRLHLTPSPVSRTIKDLEAELGVLLFIRRHHQVALTEAGAALVPRVRHILNEIDQLKPSMRSYFEDAKRVVVVGASHLAPPTDVDEFVRIVEQETGLTVEVRLGLTTDLLAAVKSNALDLAFVHLPVDEPDLDTVTTVYHPFKLVVCADDPLATSPGLHLVEVAHRTFTVPSFAIQPGAISRLHHIVGAAGITSVTRLPDADSFMLAGHIRRTGGITLTYDPRLGGPGQAFADPAFVVIDLLDGIEHVLGAVWKRSTNEQDSVLGRAVSRIKSVHHPDGIP